MLSALCVERNNKKTVLQSKVKIIIISFKDKIVNGFKENQFCTLFTSSPKGELLVLY